MFVVKFVVMLLVLLLITFSAGLDFYAIAKSRFASDFAKATYYLINLFIDGIVISVILNQIKTLTESKQK